MTVSHVVDYRCQGFKCPSVARKARVELHCAGQHALVRLAQKVLILFTCQVCSEIDSQAQGLRVAARLSPLVLRIDEGKRPVVVGLPLPEFLLALVLLVEPRCEVKELSVLA